MEEFSDIPQDELPANEATDIPIFNIPENTPSKIAPSRSEKNVSPSSNKKVEKQDDSTQALFDYVVEQAEPPVASTSGTSETSEPLEPVINKPEIPSGHPRENKPQEPVIDKPPESIKPSIKVSSAILASRQQREERLRKKAIELGEDPNVFIAITEKDRLDSITFRDRMETDSRMCAWAIETEDDPKEYMEMTVRERLIGEEIIRRRLEDDGDTSSWLDTDEKWQKTISILQENGMLW